MRLDYLSPSSWCDNSPYTLFVQPFSEAYDNYEKAFTCNSPLGKRIKHFLAALALSIPLLNAISLIALRSLSQDPPLKIEPKTYQPPFQPHDVDPPSPVKVIAPKKKVEAPKEKQFRWVTKTRSVPFADLESIYNPKKLPMTEKEKIDLVEAANKYNTCDDSWKLVNQWYDKGVKVAMKIVLKYVEVKEEIPASV